MMEGAQIGAYRILQRIGDGGMGSVWMAEHTMLGRRAAIKVLHGELSRQPEIVTRFFNEARAATAISDPGIVQIFDFGFHVDGSAYIVMELLDGEPLDARLDRCGVLMVSEALRIIRQVATSLGAAHSRGIIHRDLKPENIFLVRDPEVVGGERAKILDFGIAKLTNDQTSRTNTSMMLGTPLYMSPEQCRGAGQVDQRSDIYALGCVLFTLIAGSPPFMAEGAGELIAMHLREPAPALSTRAPQIASHIEQIVLRCMAKDPNQRFSSAGELAVAIGVAMIAPSSRAQDLTSTPTNITMKVPIAASPTTLSTAVGVSIEMRAAKRPDRVIASIAAAIVATSVGIAWFAIHRSSEPAPTTSELPKQLAAVATPPAVATPKSETLTLTPIPVPPVVAPDPQSLLDARFKSQLTSFVTWSHEHPRAPWSARGRARGLRRRGPA